MGKILKNGTEYGLGGKALIDRIYPVGSIYISTSASFNPQTAWGGTWKKTADGRCLIGANATYKLGTTGGEAVHTLTGGEMPIHSHKFERQQWLQTDKVYISDSGRIYSWKSGFGQGGATSYSYEGHTDADGASQPHNNMQPYLAVYIWERMA